MKTSFVTLFKNKEFFKLWGTQLISLVCASMLNFVLMGRIYQATGSTIAVGLLWVFFILPTVALGPFVGVFLDLIDKKKILIFSSLVQSLVVLLYLGIGQKIWPIYTIVLLYSLCDEFFNPAVGVLIPSLVKKKQLVAANSIFLFTTQGSIVLGFLLGGLILKFVRFPGFVFFLAFFFLLLATFLANLLSWGSPGIKRKVKTSLTGFLMELVRGYNFIKNEPMILFPMVLLVGLQIILGMGVIILPLLANTLSIDFADSSYVLIMPAVCGVILGTIRVERVIRKYLKRFLIIKGLFLLGISILSFGLVLPLVKYPIILGACLAFTMGIAFILMYIPLQVLIQENTPFRVRGRVLGTLSTLITLAAVLPVLTTVTLVDLFGIKLVLTTVGIGLLILAFYASRGKYGILAIYNRS